MNTKKIYIGKLNIVIGIETFNNKPFSLYKAIPYKDVLIKGNISKTLRDLESREEYSFDTNKPYIGYKYLTSVEPFNKVTGNTVKYLSKKKIIRCYRKG